MPQDDIWEKVAAANGVSVEEVLAEVNKMISDLASNPKYKKAWQALKQEEGEVSPDALVRYLAKRGKR